MVGEELEVKEIKEVKEKETKRLVQEIEFPVLQVYDWINAEDLPEEGKLVVIQKVVERKYSDGSRRYIVETDAGAVTLPWSELKKLAKEFGKNTENWISKRILLKPIPIKVYGKLRKTILVEVV